MVRRVFMIHLVTIAVAFSTGSTKANGEHPAIPFPKSLESAAISLGRLDDILEHSLILGNGDINALLYQEGGSLVLRITKNDVWDARLDTASDPPLPTLARVKELSEGEWPDRNWILPEGYELTGDDSYHAHAYPCPRACGVVRLGSRSPKLVWRQIRAEGIVNSWENRDGTATMRIEGTTGASNGYSYGPLHIATEEYSRLCLSTSGTENAKFYVDVMSPTGKIFGSGWIDSPVTRSRRVFDLPAGQQVERLILYTRTEDGKQAENRFSSTYFQGPKGEFPIDLASMEAPPVSARLDVRRAVAQVSGRSSTWKSAAVRALAQHNVFLIDTLGEAHLLPVEASYDLPAPVVETQASVTWLHQRIPGDLDWPGMSFAVALATMGDKKAVAVVTSRESQEVVASAVELAEKTVRSRSKDLIQQHEAQWEDFWSRSGVDLSDELLCKSWYHNLYFLRCVTKPAVICPGLFAGLISDRPAWHGDYHTNYNIQQTFWSCYNTNHPELAEPYDQLIREYLPRARWQARKIFNCEGAYYPHVLYAYEPAQPDRCRSRNGRQYIHHVWGMTVGVAGFTVQPLWWRYKYQPSHEYLRTVAYPAVKDVAVFYADFLDQCPLGGDSEIVLSPSVSPEHWGWTHSFERNRNCTFDIAIIRYTLGSAIEGAMILDCDKDLVKRFRQKLSVLPYYPRSEDTPQVVVDVQDAPPIVYNIAVPATPVFPGDVVTWQSASEEKTLFVRTLESIRWNGNNSMVILGVARARMSMPETVEWLRKEVVSRLRPNGTLTLNRRGHHFNSFGHYSEQFGVSMAVSELLLQSVADVIRVFPAWPRQRTARFRNLRGQGGFLVSSGIANSEIGPVEVYSTVGGPLRIVSPWKTIAVRSTGEMLSRPFTPDAQGIVKVNTRPGDCLVFEPHQTTVNKRP